MTAFVGNEVVQALAAAANGNPTAFTENAIVGQFGSAGQSIVAGGIVSPATNGFFGLSGQVHKHIVGAGVNPGATAADNVLSAFSIPANAFDASGRRLVVTAFGNVAANANSKEIKLIWNPSTAVVGSTVGSGGTTLADTGAYTTNAASAWMVSANIMKYGAVGSNTQLSFNCKAVIGATSVTIPAVGQLTATENAAILIAITGNAGTTATDITFYLSIAEAWN